jgi:hypothetical protein
VNILVKTIVNVNDATTSVGEIFDELFDLAIFDLLTDKSVAILGRAALEGLSKE